MATDGLTEERPERHACRARAKSLSTNDLRLQDRAAFVPDMPAFEEAPESRGRLIVVANRLPITVKRSEDGKYDLIPSSGGLVAGLAGMMKSTEFLWYGWPGLEIPQEDEEMIKQRCRNEHRSIPVFVPEDVADKHYNGFSNSILWPLFHYHPGEVTFDELMWQSYMEANRLFAKAIAPTLLDNDIVWVQDYHLMLLPQMLRGEINRMGEDGPHDIKIGFFLHTPFPSSEMYRILPVRNEVLEGVLESDLIGFHTQEYVGHFCKSVERILKLPASPSNGIQSANRNTKVSCHPIGIDPQKFTDALQQDDVKDRIKELREQFKGCKIILGVDRLDYIKGVPHKLHAFENFLTEHPEQAGKVKLIQIAVPSRGDVEEYQNLRAVVNELSGRINSQFGPVEFSPIRFCHTSVPFTELVALYAISDVMMVTSTRDGMNLVCYEWIVCQQKLRGALILSEFAGAAEIIRNGAIEINPWDAEKLAESVHKAVTMDEAEQQKNLAYMAEKVYKYTSTFWCESFVTDLTRISEQKERKLKVRHQSSVDIGSERRDSKSQEQITYLSTVNGSFKMMEDDSDKSDKAVEDDEDGLMMKDEPKSPPAMD